MLEARVPGGGPQAIRVDHWRARMADRRRTHSRAGCPRRRGGGRLHLAVPIVTAIAAAVPAGVGGTPATTSARRSRAGWTP